MKVTEIMTFSGDETKLTIGHLRRTKRQIIFRCSGCVHDGIFDPEVILLNDDDPVILFDGLLCTNCKTDFFDCKISEIEREPTPADKSIAEDPDFAKLDVPERIALWNRIASEAARVFPKQEMIQFSRFDSVSLFFHIKNKLKENGGNELSDEQLEKAAEQILWQREFIAKT
jgi:hypothetical protein